MKKLLKLVLALAALAVLTGNAVASSCQDDINSGTLTITAPTASNITATSASLTGTVSISPLPSGCTYTANLVFGTPPPPYALLASGTIPPISPLTLSGTASPLNPSSNYDARIEVTKACLGLASTSCDGQTNYFTTLTGASSGCVRPPSGMALWLTGDNNTNDISGNGNNGTLQGSATYTSVAAGKVSNAFSLSASSDFIEALNSASLNFTGNFSIDAWINTTSTGTATIIDKRTGTTSNPVGYHLFLYGGNLGFQLGDGSSFSGNYMFTSQPYPLNDGLWHHVAITINRISQTGGNLYIDGIYVYPFDPTTHSGNISNTANLRIGQRFLSAAQPFQGAIDEVELFNRELASSEINDIFNAASAGKCKCIAPPSGMVAWYPLDEQQGAYYVNDIAPQPSSTVNNWGTSLPGSLGPPSATNGPAPVTGQVDGALYFYTGHYVEVAPNSELDFSTGDFTVDAGVTAFTIDAWVRIVQVGATLIQPIVDKFSSQGGPGFAFYIRNQRLELALNGNTPSVSTGTLIAFANALQNTGPWAHVAVTVQGGGRGGVQVFFYINGAQAGTFTSSGTSINNALSLWIGESRLSGGRGEIAIDELELFNRALTQTEIQAIYNSGSAGKCKPKPITAADNCTATLKSRDNNYYLNEPIIKYNSSTTTYYNAELIYVPTTDNQIRFTLTNARVLTDLSPYSSCQPSILSSSGSDWMLYLANMELNGLFYWVDLKYSPTGDSISFVVNSYGSK